MEFERYRQNAGGGSGSHLRWLLREFEARYNFERPHQGLGNRLVETTAAANGPHGDTMLECRERAGGLLRYYTRRPA